MVVRSICYLTALVLAVASASGIQTRHVTHEGFRTFADGQLEGIRLGSDGTLSLGPALKRIAKLDQPTIWSAVKAEDGSLYVGVGNDGQVFRIDFADKQSTLIFDPEETVVRAMAIGPDGLLYVGTSPDGRVYRINESGRAEVYFDPESSYIWDILFAPSGIMFVATGGPARVIAVPADYAPGDKVEILLTVDQTHLNKLIVKDETTLVAATSPVGILYDVPLDDGEPSVIHHAGVDEITSIIAETDGSLTFSTFNTKGPGGGPEAANGDDEDTDTSGDTTVGIGAALKTSGSSSVIYNLSPSGFATPVWGIAGKNILALRRTTNGWLVGTDERGRIYHVGSRNEWAMIAEAPDGGRIGHFIEGPRNSLLTLSSSPAALYLLTQFPTAQAVAQPPVVDAGTQVEWGNFIAEAYPLDINLTIEARTGNTAKPDNTWSKWTTLAPVGSQPDEFSGLEEAGRFLEYRMIFADRIHTFDAVEGDAAGGDAETLADAEPAGKPAAKEAADAPENPTEQEPADDATSPNDAADTASKPEASDQPADDTKANAPADAGKPADETAETEDNSSDTAKPEPKKAKPEKTDTAKADDPNEAGESETAVASESSGGSAVEDLDDESEHTSTIIRSQSVVHRVRVFSIAPNNAPQIGRVTVVPVGFNVVQNTGNRSNLDLDSFLGKDGGARAMAPPPTRTQLRPDDEDGKITIGWKAGDPDGDPLEFAVEIKHVESDDWIKIASELDAPIHSVDIRGLENGAYRARITASDHQRNRPGEGLDAVSISEPFLIDTEPPAITLTDTTFTEAGARLTFKAVDTTALVRFAGYSINGGPGKATLPVDGMFDSREEHFTIDVPLESGVGSFAVIFEAFDQFGQPGVFTKTIKTP